MILLTRISSLEKLLVVTIFGVIVSTSELVNALRSKHRHSTILSTRNRRHRNLQNATTNNSTVAIHYEIIGGSLVTDPRKYPSFGFSNGCGLTLIHPELFLSAGHCATNFGFQIKVGGIEKYGYDGEYVNISYVIPHPRYVPDSNSNDYDILIGKLKTAANPLTPLQQLNFDKKIPQTNDNVIAIGYGRITEYDRYYGNLREVQTQIVRPEVCRTVYFGQVLSRSMICAGDMIKGGEDTCQGDSGGPLYIIDGNTSAKIQVGITSFGNGCGRARFPGVYTRISRYERWIKSMICQHSSDNLKPEYCSSFHNTTNTSNDNNSNNPTTSCPCQSTQYFCRYMHKCLL